MQQLDESITGYLKRRLREAGASRFDAIAELASKRAGLSHDDGVKSSFIRKFVYGSRENPRVQTIQPLLDYFAAVDRGEEVLPDEPALVASIQEKTPPSAEASVCSSAGAGSPTTKEGSCRWM